MADRLLRNWLKQSFPDPGPRYHPVDVDHLESELCRRRRRRQTAVGGGATVLLLAVALASLWWINVDSHPRQPIVHGPSGRPSVGSLQSTDLSVGGSTPWTAERPEMAREILLQQQMVDSLQAADRLHAAQRELERLSQSNRLQAEWKELYEEARTAALVLWHADRLRQRPEYVEQALAEYKWVARHYPDTLWSERARERMDGK